MPQWKGFRQGIGTVLLKSMKNSWIWVWLLVGLLWRGSAGTDWAGAGEDGGGAGKWGAGRLRNLLHSLQEQVGVENPEWVYPGSYQRAESVIADLFPPSMNKIWESKQRRGGRILRSMRLPHYLTRKKSRCQNPLPLSGCPPSLTLLLAWLAGSTP